MNSTILNKSTTEENNIKHVHDKPGSPLQTTLWDETELASTVCVQMSDITYKELHHWLISARCGLNKMAPIQVYQEEFLPWREGKVNNFPLSLQDIQAVDWALDTDEWHWFRYCLVN